MKKNIFIFLFFSLFLSCQIFAQNAEIKIILPAETIILKKPIEITNVEQFLDGGTLGIEIKDADGKYFQFCRDGKLKETSLADALAVASGTKKPESRHLFAYAIHPDIEGAVEIPIGEEAEIAILTMLKDWLSENPDADEIKRNVVSQLTQEIAPNFTP